MSQNWPRALWGQEDDDGSEPQNEGQQEETEERGNPQQQAQEESQEQAQDKTDEGGKSSGGDSGGGGSPPPGSPTTPSAPPLTAAQKSQQRNARKVAQRRRAMTRAIAKKMAPVRGKKKPIRRARYRGEFGEEPHAEAIIIDAPVPAFPGMLADPGELPEDWQDPQFGILTIDDMTAIQKYFASVKAVTPDAVKIQDEFTKWFDTLYWYEKTSEANFDKARNYRNEFSLANATTPEARANVDNVIKTGLSKEQTVGRVGVTVPKTATSKTSGGSADRRIPSTGMYPEHPDVGILETLNNLPAPAKIAGAVVLLFGAWKIAK